MRKTSTRRCLIGFAALASLSIVGCGSSDSGESTDSVSSSTTVPIAETSLPTTTMAVEATTTIAVPETTVAASTTVPSPPTDAPTTTSAAIAPLVLRGLGISSFDLDTEPTALIEAIDAQLEPLTSEITLYPNPGSGGYVTADGSEFFTYPVGQRWCWAQGLCIQLGGTEDTSTLDPIDMGLESLVFVGWEYIATGDAPLLYSPFGVTTGARWSDFPAITAPPMGCFSDGFGLVDGINLDLFSDGDTFGAIDPDGNFIEHSPDPATVTVRRMSVGMHPYSTDTEGDC